MKTTCSGNLKTEIDVSMADVVMTDQELGYKQLGAARSSVSSEGELYANFGSEGQRALDGVLVSGEDGERMCLAANGREVFVIHSTDTSKDPVVCAWMSPEEFTEMKQGDTFQKKRERQSVSSRATVKSLRKSKSKLGVRLSGKMMPRMTLMSSMSTGTRFGSGSPMGWLRNFIASR